MSLVVEINELYKTFQLGVQKVEALRGINLEFASGEFTSIMGESGSGKSTLLYLIGSLDTPTSGSIKINGRDIASMNDKERSALRRKNIGFVFQFYNLIPNLNVEDNIILPLLLDGKKRKDNEDDLIETIDLVGLSDRKKHLPAELSGGQQQRVAIARALMNRPDIILADEPIGNLDSKMGQAIMELFLEINQKRKTTIIQVTHSQVAADYGNRIIRLKDGMVV